MFGRRAAYADGGTRTTTTRSRGAGAVTSGRLMLARIIRLIGAIVAAIIVLGIVLFVLDANTSNSLVKAVNDAASWLVGPFKGLFSLADRKAELAVNWGLAALVYYAVAHLIARIIAR